MPLLVPLVSHAKGSQRRRLVLPDDGLQGYDSCVTTAGHIPQMIEEETVCESTRRARSNH